MSILTLGANQTFKIVICCDAPVNPYFKWNWKNGVSTLFPPYNIVKNTTLLNK